MTVVTGGTQTSIPVRIPRNVVPIHVPRTRVRSVVTIAAEDPVTTLLRD